MPTPSQTEILKLKKQLFEAKKEIGKLRKALENCTKLMNEKLEEKTQAEEDFIALENVGGEVKYELP